jgi:F-type H+-transporting ATPase subunit epsilon
MAGTFKFELVSPERVLLSGDADEALLPGTEGDMTILAGHAPVVSTLRPGTIDVSLGGTRTRIFVKSGFAEVDAERVTVLAEKAFEMSELNGERIAGELEIAEGELEEAKDDEARTAAARAVEQLKALSGKAG